MLKRVLARLSPSPAMAVALLGVVLGLGGAGWAANGAAFILGAINVATSQSLLAANYNGAVLRLTNMSAGAAATGLLLTVPASRPPMIVNSNTKVSHLNADWLDGLDSTSLTRAHNVSYNLAPGALGAPIALPVDRPVQLVGVSLTGIFQGVGQASILRSSQGFLQWVGFSYADTTPVANNSSAAGAKIVSIGYQNYVIVETAGPGTIRVHNTGAFTLSGSVSLMW